MNTLDRLFLSKWIKPTFGALITFVLLFLLVDVFGLTEDLIENWPGLNLLGYYLLLRTGYAIFFLSPMAFLIGCFWMSQTLQRQREWPVSLLSGRHPLFLIKTPLITLGIFTLILIVINLYWMPEIANRIENIRDFTFEGKKKEKAVFEKVHLRLIDDRTITIGRFSPTEARMTGIVIAKRKNSKLVERIDSPSARYAPESGWVLKSPELRMFRDDGSVENKTLPERRLPLVPPNMLERILRVDPGRSDRNPVQYSYNNLSQAIQFKSRRGMNATPETIYLHWKFGFPLTSLILGLIGFLIGFRANLGRAGGIGLCLLIGFGYWILFSFSISMGKSAYATGFLSPILPLLYVYLPPAFFLGVGALIWNQDI